MKISQTYQSNQGVSILKALNLEAEIRNALSNPSMDIDKGSGALIKTDVENKLKQLYWQLPLRIDIDLRPDINAFHLSGAALQMQTGNIARAFYDLMKLQRLFELKMTKVAILVVPMRLTAVKIGSNIANFERVTEEHSQLFSDQVNTPLVIFGIS
jgi:hypothetical protein